MSDDLVAITFSIFYGGWVFYYVWREEEENTSVVILRALFWPVFHLRETASLVVRFFLRTLGGGGGGAQWNG